MENPFTIPLWAEFHGKWSVKLSPLDSINTADTRPLKDHHDVVIYMDGSARESFRDSGAVFVVTTGKQEDPVIIHSANKRGPAFTSPFEEEREAVVMALECLKQEGTAGHHLY